MSKSAVFYVSSAGNGHLVRCRALAAELTERGWRCSLFGALPCDDPNDAGWKASGFDVVILDSYDFPESAYSRFCKPTVAIVDHADRTYKATVTVNGCAGAKPSKASASLRDGRVTLSGPSFALIRPEFREAQWTGLGSMALDIRKTTNQSAWQMAQAMAKSAAVICEGGMRALEAACVGAPIILAHSGPTHEENQRLNVAGLLRAGAAVECHESLIWNLSGQLTRDPGRLAQMSKAGRNLVDGRGCGRVADMIEALA